MPSFNSSYGNKNFIGKLLISCIILNIYKDLYSYKFLNAYIVVHQFQFRKMCFNVSIMPCRQI